MSDVTINESSMVRLENVGTTTFRKQYAGLWYEVLPGATRAVPYYAACMWFGNPYATNDPGGKDQDQHRTNEVRRLSTFYGIYADPWYVPAEETDRYTSDPDNLRPYVDHRHPGLPLIEVYSFEDDSRIYTVIDDPEGDRVSSATGSRMEQRALEEQIATLVKNQQVLIDELTKTNPQAAERLTGGIAPIAPSGPVLPDPDQTLDVTDDGFDEKTIEEVEATEDVPPSQRPAARKPAKVT